MYSSLSIMFFIFFPTNLAQKFKKSIIVFLFSYISIATKPIKSVRFTNTKTCPQIYKTQKHSTITVILSHFHYKHKDLQGFKIPSTNPKSLHALIQIYRPKQTQIAKTPNSRLLSSSSLTPTSISPLSGSNFSKMPLPKTSTTCMSTLILPSTSLAPKASSSNSASFRQKKPTVACRHSSPPRAVCSPPPSSMIWPTRSSSSFFCIKSPWSSDPG